MLLLWANEKEHRISLIRNTWADKSEEEDTFKAKLKAEKANLLLVNDTFFLSDYSITKIALFLIAGEEDTFGELLS